MEPQADTKSSRKDEFQPIEDQVKRWEFIAAKEYKFDGNADGWDSDAAEEDTPEQKYIKVDLHAFCDPIKEPVPSSCFNASLVS